MACSKYTLTNTGSTTAYFTYKNCDDEMWKYQTPLHTEQTKNIWAINGTYSTNSIGLIELVNDGVYPFTSSLVTDCLTLNINFDGHEIQDLVVSSTIGNFNMAIYWGDGTKDTYFDNDTYLPSHTYPTIGDYSIKIIFSDNSIPTSIEFGDNLNLKSFSGIKNLSGLISLNIHDTNLTLFNPTGGLPETLQSLTVGHNPLLTTFNPTTQIPSSITYLDLSENAFTSFAPVLSLPAGLTYFSLYNNYLSSPALNNVLELLNNLGLSNATILLNGDNNSSPTFKTPGSPYQELLDRNCEILIND